MTHTDIIPIRTTPKNLCKDCKFKVIDYVPVQTATGNFTNRIVTCKLDKTVVNATGCNRMPNY